MSSTSHNPEPKLFIFNVSTAGARHTCEMPASSPSGYLFLPSFASALGLAVKHGAIVQGAIYSGGQVEGATIFIDSEDEEWASKIGIERREEVEKRLDAKILEQAKKNQANLAQPTQSTSQASESTSSAQKYPVSIFKVGGSTNAPQQYVPRDTLAPEGGSSEENRDEESQPLLRAFIEAIYSLVNQGAEVEGAMYGPEEGAKIFVRRGE